MLSKMANIKYEEFIAETQDWIVYEERLEQHFSALDVKDDKKVAILLSSVGQEAYKLLREVSYPKLPKEKSYQELAGIMKRHFSKQTNCWRERRKFYELKQNDGESMVEWMTRVKKGAIFCEFNDGLEGELINRFICGITDSVIFEKLSEEKTALKLDDVVKIAQAKEAVLNSKKEEL